jgi:hypothetical protein
MAIKRFDKNSRLMFKTEQRWFKLSASDIKGSMYKWSSFVRPSVFIQFRQSFFMRLRTSRAFFDANRLALFIPARGGAGANAGITNNSVSIIPVHE